MKTSYFRFLTLILFVCSFAFTACKNDNEEPSNALEFGGENIPLVKGFIYSNNYNNDLKRYYVSITSKEVTANNGECINIDGTVLLFTLLIDKNISSLPKGTYSLGNTINTIDFVSLLTNYNPQTGDYDDSLSDNGGSITTTSVTVSKSGEVYTFDFTFNYTKEGQSKTAKGRFKGSLSAGVYCD